MTPLRNEPCESSAARTLRRTTGRITSLLRGSLFVLIATVVSCSSGGSHFDTTHITPDELLAGSSLEVPAGPPVVIADEQDILAVSDEMRQFLDAHVDRSGYPEPKLQQLVSAIIGSDTFGVEYDDRTRTASETFRGRRGNCLSFATMFIAMARDVGLNVEYQEVDVPPDWTLDKDTFVLNQHVNVYVDLGPAGRRIVDFNIGDFRASYEMQKISDARALAHYYNNVGVERMQAGDTASALAYFRKAIVAGDQRFSPAWTNLGTLYMRHGDSLRAEAAYLAALKASAGDLVAMSNLARLYQLRGDTERASRYQKRVAYHRKLNPYYRYELARQAYRAENYDEAIGHLKFAIRKRPREDRFYFLLGLTYLRKGNTPAAQRWLARAQEVAATDALKRKYSNKIDILLRHGVVRD